MRSSCGTADACHPARVAGSQSRITNGLISHWPNGRRKSSTRLLCSMVGQVVALQMTRRAAMAMHLCAQQRLSNPSCKCSGLQKRKIFLSPVSVSPGEANVHSLVYHMFRRALKQGGDAASLSRMERGPMHVRQVQGFTSSSRPSMRHAPLRNVPCLVRQWLSMGGL